LLAFLLELTNDEVNYWTYALYPALSYFDHPPLVGWLIRATTLNLLFTDEIFVRLSSVIFGAINTYVIFKIGTKIKDEIAGLYAAMLYNASIYCFLITGIFIMPDTPQLLFWLIALFYFIDAFTAVEINKQARKSMLYAGIFTGLALLSKYHSAFLWVGAVLYIIFRNRKWLKAKELYFALIISFILFIPVLYWNYQHSFISFTFQGERVDIFKSGFRFDYFLTELGGEIFYTNPVVFILIIISLFGIKKIQFKDNTTGRIILSFALPNIIVFLVFSLFRRTLPHWTGPGYMTLLIFAASYFSQRSKEQALRFRQVVPVLTSVLFMLIIVIGGYIHINYSIFSQEKNINPTSLGREDLTLDMYGWKQVQTKFKELNEKYIEENRVGIDAPIISNKWYNAGHVDYYIGRIMNKNVFAAGNLNDIRNYLFVNRNRGNIRSVESSYYITPSRDYKNPEELFGSSYSKIVPLDTIRVMRRQDTVENVFIYSIKR
jgi:hypothetical protein